VAWEFRRCFFLLVCCVTVWVLVIIFPGSGFHGFEINNECVENDHSLVDEDFISSKCLTMRARSMV